MESKTILDAYSSGNLQNALYTNANNVSAKAQAMFSSVYTNARDNTANIVKNIPPIAAGAKVAVGSGLSALGSFLSTAETVIVPLFIYYNPNHKLYRTEKS